MYFFNIQHVISTLVLKCIFYMVNCYTIGTYLIIAQGDTYYFSDKIYPKYHGKLWWYNKSTDRIGTNRKQDIDKNNLTFSDKKTIQITQTYIWTYVIYDTNSVKNVYLYKLLKLRVAHAQGIPGTFSPPSRVSYPNMHHGTCSSNMANAN